MAKQNISSYDLSWIFLEELQATEDCPTGVALAVIPDGEGGGWRVVIETRSRQIMTPKCARRVAIIERRLRSLYTLDG
ncbi:hypothetical protein [Bradyrhizobium guangdongense]|uniref:Uncharacterized protein n=1 Tax=Bradyrhizobium guangdongense TaxID=1325090 RepID=A0AA88BCV9_9BRAD|nr:hypothetical protein [Bradyrhizobium guangdongense]GGI34345.1 hypothetical protein GCM10010987_78930 [Bradyrhizobium guangdongense]